MEDLTKQQMVLLTLLVSFVASIATSISVVSLLNETPQTITQTINRIVEKTIEKVVPVLTSSPVKAPEETPLNRHEEDERITKATDMNLPAMVTLWSWKTATEEETERGVGFSVSSDGLVITDKNILGESLEYSAVFPDGKIYKAKKAYVDKNSDIVILQLRDEKDQNATSTPFVSFSSNEPSMGTLVFALGGKAASSLYMGIVSEKTKTYVVTNISFKPIDRGGILFGMDGKVLGMNIFINEEKRTIGSPDILSVLENYRKAGAVKAP